MTTTKNFGHVEWNNMSPSTNNIRKAAVPIVVMVIATIMMYPGIQTLLRGAPLENGITQIVVGLLTLILYLGFKLIERISVTSGFGTKDERSAILALLASIIGINAVLIYAVPDSPEAVGMLIVCVIGALVVLFDLDGRRFSSQS
ncbi:hypothetical protein [Natrinema halophilum]|uniref:Uncharacterized protein n=1 Tax=Natrinema halophilum TaxID=1699371 RepID=A0A7D5KIN8_9EURY|nr:hypothetical protein [Natrinema halophilum]QLG48739.1 hypothetical protein HYG82_07705 [Natrinema halophilum]